MADEYISTSKAAIKEVVKKLAGDSISSKDESMMAQHDAGVGDKMAGLEIGDKPTIAAGKPRIIKDGDHSGINVVIHGGTNSIVFNQ